MTVSSENALSYHNVSGGATSFAFDFKAYDTAHVIVQWRAAATNVITQLSRNVHYTIALNADQASNPGGVVQAIGTWLADLTSPDKVTIFRRTPATQTADLVNGDGFDAETLERRLDLLAMALGDLKAELARCLKIARTYEFSEVNTTIGRPAAGRLIAWNDDANGFANDVPISSTTVPDGSVTESKIAPGAVTTAKIPDGAVTPEKLSAAVLTNIWAGNVNANGKVLSNPILRGCRENYANMSINSGESRLLIDLTAANIQRVTLTQNIAAFTITHAGGGDWMGGRLYIRQDGTGGRTIDWPSIFKWPDGTPPTLSTAAGAIDVVLIATMDNGVTWEAELVAAGLSGLGGFA